MTTDAVPGPPARRTFSRTYLPYIAFFFAVMGMTLLVLGWKVRTGATWTSFSVPAATGTTTLDDLRAAHPELAEAMVIHYEPGSPVVEVATRPADREAWRAWVESLSAPDRAQPLQLHQVARYRAVVVRRGRPMLRFGREDWLADPSPTVEAK